MTATSPHAELATLIADYYDDPLGYVLDCFPWGEPGELINDTGPDDWQRKLLTDIGGQVKLRNFNGYDPVAPLRFAVASGHGIGKGVMMAWLACWIMDTRPMSQGTITANTGPQLASKTWPAVQRWRALSITKDWWVINSEQIYNKTAKEQWFLKCQTCAEENSEAFAGQHKKDSTSYYLFDEACHDTQTEVMTERGWMLFKDLEPGIQVLSMDPATGIADYYEPTRVYVAPRNEPMFEYAPDKGASFCVTPDHAMLVRERKRTGKKRHLGGCKARPIKDLGRNAEYYIPRTFLWERPDRSFCLPALEGHVKSWPCRTLDGDKMAEFLGWFGSEGSFCYQQGKPFSIAITQHDPEVRQEIMGLIRDLGFNPKEYAQQVQVHDRQLAADLIKSGRYCTDKGIPAWVRFASARQIRIFLRSYLRGDGYVHHGREIYYTSSQLMAGHLQELIFKAGGQSIVKNRALEGKPAWIKDHWTASTVDGYVVSCQWDTTQITLKTKKLKKIPYDGLVYCAEVEPHHTLFTRRNGYAMWSGNSAIPAKIWEKADGGLTDGEPMFFAFGNPTRNTGEFYEVCFGAKRHRWDARSIDSRTCRFPNKSEIDQWIQDYGIDSDRIRYMVLGLPPQQSELQLIGRDLIEGAQNRTVYSLSDEPLIAGVDVPDGGSAWFIVRFRRGLDAKSIPPIRVAGSRIDRQQMLAKLSELMADKSPEKRIAAMFIDSAFGAPLVERLHTLNFQNVYEVNFGSNKTPDAHFLNMRAFMWGKQMKDWLEHGAIDKNDAKLAADMMSPGWHYNATNQIVLESKAEMAKRGIASPDDGDALALTFAQTVAPPIQTRRPPSRGTAWS